MKKFLALTLTTAMLISVCAISPINANATANSDEITKLLQTQNAFNQQFQNEDHHNIATNDEIPNDDQFHHQEKPGSISDTVNGLPTTNEKPTENTNDRPINDDNHSNQNEDSNVPMNTPFGDEALNLWMCIRHDAQNIHKEHSKNEMVNNSTGDEATPDQATNDEATNDEVCANKTNWERENLGYTIAAIEKALPNIEQFLTTESKQQILAQLNHAKEIYNNENLSQKVYKFEALNLVMCLKLDAKLIYNNAYLQKIVADIKSYIDNNSSITCPFSEDTIKKLTDALNEGMALIEKGNVSADEIKDFCKKVENIIINDKGENQFNTPYEELVNTIKSFADDYAKVAELYNTYTKKSVDRFVAAYEKALAVQNMDNPTNKQCNEAIKMLNAAFNKLKDINTKKGDLYSHITQAADFIIGKADSENYSETDLANFREEILNAEDLYINEQSDEDAVVVMTDKLASYGFSDVQEITGDFNNDSNLNISDVTDVQKYLADIDNGDPNVVLGDVDGDQQITIKDTTLIQKRLAEQIQQFAADDEAI